MSLNGLDSEGVENAYQAVLQGRGGWFLLNYTSRDSVEALSQGSKGLNEMREAAEAYYNDSSAAPHSPLYGMIDFRRRKVLLKLVVEGTSRLIQARVQVHWNYVTARFSKHETLFEATSSEQLNESGLTAHIELHSSRSSSGSVKKPVLDGIEEKEEVTTPERKAERERASQDEGNGLEVPAAYPTRTSSLISAETSAAIQDLASGGEDSQANMGGISVPEVSITLDEPPTPPPKDDPKPRYSMTLDSPSGADWRLSSQSARPSTSDPFDPSFYDSLYKPKVKLGPRPSMQTDRRPAKSPAAAVASLPAGLRAARPASRQTASSGRPQSSSSRTQASGRPKSRDSTMYNFRSNFPPPPPIPESSVYMQRPTSSSNSVKSLPATLTKSPGMTKEKQRLMKFQEMYKKKEKQRAKSKEISASESAGKDEEAPNQVENTTRLDIKPNNTDEDTGNNVFDSSDHTKSDSAVCMDKESVDSEAEEPEPMDSERPVRPPDKDGKEVPSAEQPEPAIHEQPLQTVDIQAEVPAASSSTLALESSGPASTRPTSASQSSQREEENADRELDNKATIRGDSPSVLMESPSNRVSTHDFAKERKHEDVPERETASEKEAPVCAIPTSTTSTQDGQEEDDDVTPTADIPLSVAAPSNPSSTAEPSEMTRRRALVTPLSIAASEANSEHSYDDEFMDELDEAEVHEALSVSVNKSPITPFFPRRPSMPLSDVATEKNSPPRSSPPRDSPPRSISAQHSPPSVYRPTRGNSPSPFLPSQSPGPSPSDSSPTSMFRSSSGTLLAPINEPEELISVPKRMKIGGGVAAKIADLQRSFSRGSAPSVSSSPVTVKSTSRKPSFLSQRVASSETPTPSFPSQMQSSRSIVRGRAMSKDSFQSNDTTSTLPRNNSASSIGKLDNKRLSTYTLPQIDTKTETISVKATIIRTDGPARREMLPPTDATPLQLHESPLVISHQRPQSTVQLELPPEPAPMSRHHKARSSISQLLPSIRSSSSLHLPNQEQAPTSPASSRESATFPRVSQESSWRTMGRRRSESKSPSAKDPTSPGSIARSMSSDSIDSVTLNDRESIKKGSKSSRLMKRMSNSLSSIASVTRLPLGPLNSHSVREDEQESAEVRRPDAMIIGDLNVQFPDTLLWKRRWVEIDSQGYIVLKPPAEARSNGGITKKYHLSEFTTPFAPDLERQEMPNSIMMDFRDGRTMQCQTQSLAAQRDVLKTLSDAHRAWNS